MKCFFSGYNGVGTVFPPLMEHSGQGVAGLPLPVVESVTAQVSSPSPSSPVAAAVVVVVGVAGVSLSVAVVVVSAAAAIVVVVGTAVPAEDVGHTA